MVKIYLQVIGYEVCKLTARVIISVRDVELYMSVEAIIAENHSKTVNASHAIRVYSCQQIIGFVVLIKSLFNNLS